MCKHIFWGLVTIVEVGVEAFIVDGIDRRLVTVHADALYEIGHGCAPYCTQAWFEHLKPLNRAAADMLVACVQP